MRVLALDVWQDLREKRLVPVAAVLLVGLIAIPLFLLKPADGFEAPPVVSPTAGAAGGDKALVALAVLADDSKLEVFESKNPFKPLKRVGSLSGDSGVPEGASAPGSSGAHEEVAAGADGVGPNETGGNSTTGSDTETGGGAGDTATTAYTYNVDVSFGERGDLKDVKDLDRLEMLPDEEDPLLVFLGVDTAVENAVFLVDSSLAQSGEGDCKPDAETCSFLYLTLDEKQDEHSFTDGDGTEFELKLQKINKVTVDPDTGAPTGSSSRARNRAGVFGYPLFTDIVSAP